MCCQEHGCVGISVLNFEFVSIWVCVYVIEMVISVMFMQKTTNTRYQNANFGHVHAKQCASKWTSFGFLAWNKRKKNLFVGPVTLFSFFLSFYWHFEYKYKLQLKNTNSIQKNTSRLEQLWMTRHFFFKISSSYFIPCFPFLLLLKEMKVDKLTNILWAIPYSKPISIWWWSLWLICMPFVSPIIVIITQKYLFMPFSWPPHKVNMYSSNQFGFSYICYATLSLLHQSRFFWNSGWAGKFA